MRNWTIGKKLFTGIAALVALMAITGWLGVRNAADLNSRIEEAAGPVAEQIKQSGQVQAQANGIYENALETFVAASQKDHARLENVARETATEIEELEKDIESLGRAVDDDKERQLVASLKTTLAQWKNAFQRAQASLEQGDLNEARALDEKEIAPASRAMAKLAKTISDAQYEQMAESKKQAAQAYSTSRTVTIGALVFALLIVAAVVFMVRGINRSLRQTAVELSEAADQTSNAASQVSSSSQSLAQGSSQQAASLEETSASSEEISSMARKNSENSSTAANLVTQSQQKFEETNESLEHMVAAMGEINTSSDRISKIIKVIDEIAFQTNILALNAAVEAARAGEAGMGFAVVADEVRNLAQRCAQAAKDTAGLIEESIAKSNDGKTKVDLVAVAIRSITEQSAKVKTLVDEVNLGSEEQARGIDQIGKAIAQMEQVTQTTAASAEESASAAEELNAQSVALKHIVDNLTAMVGGGAVAKS